ncbi:MAG: holo-ACP synthase [Verrucomicrobiales bacterium]
MVMAADAPIFGIGIDVVETVRLGRSLEKFGDRFKDRIFTELEQRYCDSMKFPARHYAARFAAKEAISKAFGTGIGKRVGWKDMEILRHDSGEPYAVLHGGAREFAEANGVSKVLVSLTHADDYAAANAVALT